MWGADANSFRFNFGGEAEPSGEGSPGGIGPGTTGSAATSDVPAFELFLGVAPPGLSLSGPAASDVASGTRGDAADEDFGMLTLQPLQLDGAPAPASWSIRLLKVRTGRKRCLGFRGFTRTGGL